MLQVRDPSQIIDEQFKVLQQVAKLARTPLGLAAMMDFAQRHGERAQTREQIQTPEEQPAAARPIGEVVTKVLPLLRGEFSTVDIEKRLLRERYSFKAKNPRQAIGKALQRLIGQEKIVEVKKGTGGNPNTYKLAS